MFHDLYKKISKLTFTLRFSILSIFVSLFFVTAMLLLASTSYLFEKTLSYTSFELMDNISLSALNAANSIFEPAEQQTKFTAHLIQENVISLDNDEIINYGYHIVDTWPYIDAARWGDEKGNFVISQQKGSNSPTITLAQRLTVTPHLVTLYRNLQEKIIRTELSSPVLYDPRIRPWYTIAKTKKHSVWTNLYITQNDKSLVITNSIPVFQNEKFLGVFGLDIKVDTLVDYIKHQKVSAHGFSFIVTSQGKLIAFPNLNLSKSSNENQVNLPDIHEISMNWLANSLDDYNQFHRSNWVMNNQGITYYISYRPIPILAENQWLIGVVVPKSDFTQTLEKLHRINLTIYTIMLSLGLLFLYILVKRVTKPIKLLVKETEKIRQLDFAEDIRLQSRIKEVILLTNAMYAMKKGLRSFQKYVPKTLVKQLIETQEDSRIGGVRKPLVVLFTDIKDFTYISESLDPNDLMTQICQYFEELTKIIIHFRGTIDKYIGDSIMAFWGAPIPDDDAAIGAATAAVLCYRQLDLLNAEWNITLKPVLYTRMGIHMGEATVGNLGSSERLNYTAVGDVINMTSRLENINKTYGTRILVSDVVYELIKNRFYLRLIDRVAVRGKKDSNYIYELLEQDLDRIKFDIIAYREIFEKGFAAYQKQQWDDAIGYFNQCIQIYPDDTVAPVLIDRCKTLQKAPPPPDWDGIWRMPR